MQRNRQNPNVNIPFQRHRKVVSEARTGECLTTNTGRCRAETTEEAIRLYSSPGEERNGKLKRVGE